jgi:hypothetical protein
MSGEPPNFNARAMARWLAIRGRPRAERQPPGPRPTIAELQRSHCWTWVPEVQCPNCREAMRLMRHIYLTGVPNIYVFYCQRCQYVQTVKEEKAAA